MERRRILSRLCSRMVTTSQLNERINNEKADWLKVLNEGKKYARRSNIVLDKSGVNTDRFPRKVTLNEKNKHKLDDGTSSKVHQNGNHSEEEKDDKSSCSNSPEGFKGRSTIGLDKDDPFLKNEILNKDEILQSLSTIFYQTQFLNNNSQLSTEIAGMDTIFKKINQRMKDLAALNQEESKEEPAKKVIIENLTKEISDLRSKWTFIIDSYENVREMLYPVAEKIALIELQQNPYRIPGDPYKKIQVKQVEDENDEAAEDEDLEEEKIRDNSEDSDDSIDDDMFFDFDDQDIFIPQDEVRLTKITSTRSATMAMIDMIPEMPWRTTLPYLRPPKLKFSIWSIIKNAIGKDLTKFSVPVYFNEPISMLQKGGEAMEYEELLVKADKCPDSLKRIAYISAFNVSQYANLEGRNLKP